MRKILLFLSVFFIVLFLAGCNFEDITNEDSKDDSSSIDIVENNIEIVVKETLQINYRVNKIDTPNTQIEWESSDINVVTVSSLGEIYAVSEGTAIITAIYKKDNNVKDSVEVKVVKYKRSSDNEYIVIGMSGPLTGGASVYGIAVQHSAEMAIEEINAKGGVNGYKLKLVATDDQHDRSKVSDNFATLMEAGMQVSLGCVTTSPCMLFKELSKETNVFFITPSATGDAIPEFANGYQMCFADTRQGTFSAKYVNDNLPKTTKVGVLYLAGDDYSEGIYNNFKANLDKDFELVEASFTEGDKVTDLSSQVEILKDCDFIFLPIYYTPASVFMTQGIGKVKDSAVYFGCDGLDGIDSAIEGFNISTIPQEVSYIANYNMKATDGALKEYIDKYKAKYGAETLNQFGASAYDCVYAIANALEEACKGDFNITPETSASDVCEALKTVFQGGFTFIDLNGNEVQWDSNRFVIKNAAKYVVKGQSLKK